MNCYPAAVKVSASCITAGTVVSAKGLKGDVGNIEGVWGVRVVVIQQKD